MATIYWIDANVLIEANKTFFPMDRAPRFWTFISEKVEAGLIRMPGKAWKEVTDGNDDVARWCKVRKGTGLNCSSSAKDVQDCYGTIANHINGRERPHQVKEFLRGADGWVIAHAMACKGTAVTKEYPRSKETKIKIPTVCKELEVRWRSDSQMLDELDFRMP